MKNISSALRRRIMYFGGRYRYDEGAERDKWFLLFMCINKYILENENAGSSAIRENVNGLL